MAYQRKRKLLAFMILVQLLYGRHSSVTWTAPWTCTIKSQVFSDSIGTRTTYLRQYLEWLKRNKYITELEIGHGYITLTLVPPHDRSAPSKEG